MKKTTMVLLFSLTTILSFGQEFLGIKVDGIRQETVNKFIAKGFKVVNVSGGNENVTSMEGSYGGTNYEVLIVNTPKSKKVWKISVYLPKQTSWYSLKSSYQEYLTTLTTKYGEPTKTYSFFSSPYYEGDGYELSAVSLEKCTYYAYWDNISIQISKYQQIKISYENAINSALDTEEKKNINKNVF